MNKMTFQQSEHINIPRKVNSILKYGSSYNGHQSDDSDSDDDEQIRRKFINLNSGRGMIISSNTFTPHLDLNKSAGHQDQGYYENVMFHNENQLSRKSRSLKYRHGGIPVPPIDLDNIQMNNECEYGFNPNRLSGSKADYRLKLRPLSVYSPKPQKIPLKYSNSDADERYSTVSPRRPISHASNDLEYDLEQELATIRSQPSNIKFQGCKGKVNQKEFLEDLASSRKYRKIRRQLSFDSHPTRKWQKTVSLDSGLASSSFKRSKSNDSISEKEGKSQSQTLLDIDEGESMRPGLKRLSFSAEYIIDDITPASTPDEDDNKTLEKTTENLDESISEEEAQPDEVRIVPKFVEELPPTEDLLLSNSSKSYTVNKSNEKQKRRNIPHILNAFRIPNKKLKKLMKKRPSDSHNSPLKATHDFNEDVTLIETQALDNQESSSENTTPRVKVSMGTDNESFDDSVNTFTKHDELNDSTDFGELKSSCSLPKVDEDKESLEFTISKSPFDHRRSKSSCNITTVNTAESTPQKDEKRQSRRMSDTILSDKPAPHHTHSPSKRFIRKIFSPMVCGVPSPDRRHLFTNNGSLLSLGSYDSASVISDHEQDAYPQLFDFGSHELMEEMTLIDKELLVRIPWGELSILGWMSTDKYIIAPNIMKMVEFFNRVVMMVTTSILSEENVYRRAKIIQKAIKLALKFRYQKNFNSLKAVLGGLQCTPIFRLKQTWKQVPSRYRRVFRELSELMSEENNFYNYRMVLRESMEKPPCIPFLGNFLTTVAHTHAFVSVNYKYKKDSAIESGGESDSNRTSPSPTSSPHEGEDESSNKNSELDKQIDPCLRSSTSKIHSASHMRTDSDDSGVVLNVHRLSRSSDDLETSPREESLSSPDDDGRVRFHEEVFDKKNSQQEDEECFCPSNQETEKAKKPRFSDTDLPSTTTTSSTPNPTRTQLSVCPRHRRSVSEIIMSPTRHHSRSISDAGIRNANDINNVINNRPVAGKENSGLYTCELQFWKYQINAVQYKIIPKSYIRRYLMNCPYNTEEENYKLSLKREPPAPR